MNKVTVIGDTSSGKTCFLYAMYNFIAMGYVEGFTISANDTIVDANLQQAFEQLENTKLGPNRFPSASQRRDSFIFSLQYGFVEVASFEWADYPGGHIGSKEQELVTDLQNSDAWVIFIDGERLCDAISIADEQKKKKAIVQICGKYNQFIGNLAARNIKVPQAIPIIITKGDLIINSNIENINDKITNAIKTGISAAFAETFNSLVSISIVSLGDEIACNNYSGDLEPINIEYPITISMLSILNSLFDEKFIEVARLKELIRQDYENFFSSAKKRQQWQNEIDKITPYLDKWQKMAKAILNTLSDNKKLYIKGEELSMVEYYQKEFLIINS